MPITIVINVGVEISRMKHLRKSIYYVIKISDCAMSWLSWLPAGKMLSGRQLVGQEETGGRLTPH